jgi:ribosomal protein L11 methyltransferase
VNYVQVDFPLGSAGAESLGDALAEAGALSVTFSDAADEPVLEPLPGEVRLWSQTTVSALFDDSQSADTRLAQVTALLDPAAATSASVRLIADRAWEREWLQHFHPMRFGSRLCVYPTASEEPVPPGAAVLWLDPGLAFGTGTHATTAQCLEMIDATDWHGRWVLDYGCGSGILCIAALLLGAAGAAALDIDPQAITALRDNALRNGVWDKIRALPAQAALTPVDCVLANILAQPLIELAPRLSGACKPGGELILSGILEEQAQSVIDAYAPGCTLVEHRQREGWSCLRLARRG